MIPILLYIIYKKKGKAISRAAKSMLGKAKAKRLLKKATKKSRPENNSRKRPIKNVYSKFRNRRFNRKRAGD